MLNHMKWPALLAAAALLTMASGCAGASATAQQESAGAASAETPRASEAADEASDDAAAEEKAEQLTPLDRELARLEEKAERKLFSSESDCSQMEQLEECRRVEQAQSDILAGMCYRDQVDLALADQCMAWQLIKAAATFERGGERNAAVETRMDAMRLGGPYASVLTVDAADWLVENGRPQRARFFYGLYLTTEPDGALTDYVQARCAELGGSCDVRAQRGAPKP